MRLLEMRGGYLYEHRPDIFPHKHLTEDEVTLWSVYYEMRDKERRASDGGRHR